MTTDMNALIREAAGRDRDERGPQPQWSTPSSQPRHADISAGASGAGMPGYGPLADPNLGAMRAWEREYGYADQGDPISALREAVAEKRMGKRAGWR